VGSQGNLQLVPQGEVFEDQFGVAPNHERTSPRISLKNLITAGG
jgi:hypothetical protein